MLPGTMGGSFFAVCRLALLGLLVAGGSLHAQDVLERDPDLADRPISSVRIVGADAAGEQLIHNNLRIAIGDPYDGQTVRDDVSRIYNLGRFMFVTAEAVLAADGSVEVIYTVTVQPTINAVQTIGNKAIPDQELRAVIRQVPGGPRDQYQIEKAKRDIKALYRKKGYYLTDVSVDETEIAERGLLIFNVIEGPRVRVKAIEFDGADSFPQKLLENEIKTRTHIPFLRPGVLDEEIIAEDKAALDRFYKDRGYLDVRVGHTVALSPDNTEAKVTYLFSEGRQYTLRSVRTENIEAPGQPIGVFSADQIAALLEIRTGDIYSRDKIRKSVAALDEAYGMMGYLDVEITASELRSGPEAEVDLLLGVAEGRQSKVGLISINGNFLTKDKVIRRLLRLRPGRPYDKSRLDLSRRLVGNTRLFSDVRLTEQDPDPAAPEYRDLLVEVKETNTGSVNFGVAVGSDSGVFGEFSVTQRNFDVADFPESFSELVAGRAFRGAGQRFNMVFRPGDEIFQYAMSLTEPHFLETDYAFSVSGSFRRREFTDYEEERLTGSLGLTRSLGDIWQIGFTAQAEEVELSDFSPQTPVEIVADAGPNTLATFGVSLTRTTVGTITRPGRGSRLRLSLDSVTGDFEFFRSEVDYTLFFTLDEDFLGRRTTLRLSSRLGYIFGGESPTYERFYLGGRSFRGFDFREISPKGTNRDGSPNDEPIGGDFLMFVGAQYEFPLFEETISGVLFMDTGSVTEDFGLADYRVSVGFGVRLYIAALGPVPIAFDFGIPLRSEERDEERVLSFSAELPFR